jgi:hypothetical protein
MENLRGRAAKDHLELTAPDLDNRLHISIPFVGEAIDSDPMCRFQRRSFAN